MEIAEIKKLDQVALKNKLDTLVKNLFDHRQKLRQGELKDFSVIRKDRKTIARILTVLNGQPVGQPEVKPAEKTEEKPKAKKQEKPVKAKKAGVKNEK